MGQKRPTESGSLTDLIEKGRESAAGLAVRTKEGAQRVRVAFELRRLESRIRSEFNGLGRDVFPLLEEGSLPIDLPPGVRQRLHDISGLQDELERRKAQMNDLRTAAESEATKRESMMNTDANATEKASAVQTAKDAAASAADQPTEEGGQG